jgi:hypothetical protein
MSDPAQTSLREPKSGTCDISPTHNSCRKAEPGGTPAQSQRPPRSTDRWACERCQPYRAHHRTAIRRVLPNEFLNYSILRLVWTRSRNSLALASPRINRRRPQRGNGYGRFGARQSARSEWESTLNRRRPLSGVHVCWRDGDLY